MTRARTLKGAKTKRPMKSALFRQTAEKRIADSLRLLKKLRDAEWMVTPDWVSNPRDRDEILERVDEILNSKWAQKYLTKE